VLFGRRVLLQVAMQAPTFTDQNSRAHRLDASGLAHGVGGLDQDYGSAMRLQRVAIRPAPRSTGLAEIGLELEPSLHHVGPINQLPRQWTSKPFRTTVKMVCGTADRRRTGIYSVGVRDLRPRAQKARQAGSGSHVTR